MPKPDMRIRTSTRSNSNGSTCFPLLNDFSGTNIQMQITRLKFKDRLIQRLGLNPSQISPIRHPDKPQRNITIQNNTRAQMHAHRTITSYRHRFFQIQSRGIHSQAGSSRNQRSSGNQRSFGGQKRNSSTASAAAGLGAGMALGASGGKGGGNGSDDDGRNGGKYKSSKSPSWRQKWSNSEQGSYMTSIVSSHIHYRGVDYFQLKIDGKTLWISLHSSGYKFNAWTAESKASDSMKLKLVFQFNANAIKPVKDCKSSELYLILLYG